jgi:hypothetical protein
MKVRISLLAVTALGLASAAIGQSGAQYLLVEDYYGNLVGGITGNGMQLELNSVPGVTISAPQRIEFAVSSVCADGSVASGSSCPASAPAVGRLMTGAVDAALAGDSTFLGISKVDSVYPGDKYIVKASSSGSKVFSGGAVRITAGPGGNPWVVNSRNEIWRWTGSEWNQLPGAATDIGGNGSGAVWVIGMDSAPYRWDASGEAWVKGSGAGVSIAVGPDGNPWMTNSINSIWKYDGSAWVKLPGGGTDVAVANDGTAYVVGTGGSVFKMAAGSSTWVAVPGATGVRRIAAGSSSFVAVK